MLPECVASDEFPFTVPALAQGIDLVLDRKVSFFVGENGSGKSTLLEAVAENCGFGSQGGSRDHQYGGESSSLAQALRLSWLPKVSEGFFLRAESFFNLAGFLDVVGDPQRHGGRSLHAQSHGESFMALFEHRFEQGLFLLDEPEAALSPQRQLGFLRLIHELTQAGQAQFLIASHSPILLAFPGAALYAFSGEGIHETSWRETEHYRLTRDFLNSPERYFKHLFSSEE